MNDGMKIILERMKTHPEEFTDSDNPFAYNGKWTGLIHKYEANLPKEDLDAFKNAIDEIRQAEFTAKVMEELLDPKEELQLTLKQARPSATLSVGQTLGAYSNTAHATLNVEVNRKPLVKVRKPQQGTLFGKLFNYL